MTPYSPTHPLTQFNIYIVMISYTNCKKNRNLRKSIDFGLSILLIHGNEHFVVFKQHDPLTEFTSLLSLSQTFGIDDEQTDEFVFSPIFLKPFAFSVSVSCSLLTDCILDVEFLDEYAFEICSAMLSDDERKCVQLDERQP